jgi:hypothetical protein
VRILRSNFPSTILMTQHMVRGLLFETTASEGAILTMPVGAVSHDLENVLAFSDYIAANAYKWYKFALTVRGRKVKNGQIRLVTGCDKTTSWGMAVLSNMTQQRKSQLKFKAMEDTKGPSSTTAYTWEYSGMAEVRAGPDTNEIIGLRDNEGRSVDASPLTDQEFSNQCLFVRTLNATLSDDVWGKLNDNLGLETVPNSNPPSGDALDPSSANRQVGSSTTTSHNQQSSPATRIVGTQRSRLSEPPLENNILGKNPTISTTPDSATVSFISKFPQPARNSEPLSS